MAVTKDSRIAVRLSADQEALIKRAAESEGATVTDFTVRATVTHAIDVLADRHVFVLNDAAWADFRAVLDRPVQTNPALVELLAEPSVFVDEA
ncbi:DUF1778 domain-containing protein [Nocardioides speluncae]|uniref:type II toxin-antitoxin system TacA family antitoxin n=1 Tax=Nocardioides speluncae TaxID=2670337 RepID=UPI000D68DC1A|nr:DUF1778 domain-containing protein [Nocardioides speluncae]